MLNKILTKIDGYKTYIGALVIFVAGGFNALCNLPIIQVCLSDDIFKTIAALGAAITVVGLRGAITKLIDTIKK